jgi:hypothetical protein
MRAELKFLTVSILFLSFSIGVTAPSVLEPREASANPEDPAYFSLSVFSGQGDYSVTVDGPGETVAAPREFSLQEEGNRTVNIWFRPSRSIESGSYRLGIDLRRNGDPAEEFSPLVRVDNDHRVEITGHGQPSCSDMTVEVSVENTGFHSEDLVASSRSEVKLGVLEPGEMGSVNVTLREEGKVSVSSRTSYAFDSEKIDVPSCERERSTGSFLSGTSDLAVASVLLVSVLAALFFLRSSSVEEVFDL